jgi:hypothetical protein
VPAAAPVYRRHARLATARISWPACRDPHRVELELER